MNNQHSDAFVFFGATGDPVLKPATPVYEYEPNSWGPSEVERLLPPGGWNNPKNDGDLFAVAA